MTADRRSELPHTHQKRYALRVISRLSLATTLLLTATAAAQSESWTLRSLAGDFFGPKQIPHTDATVLAWHGLDCPMSKVYLPRLGRIAQEYGKRGARFFLIDSNVQDELSRFRKLDVPTRLARVHDRGGRLARRFSTTRTTEVLVLDPTGAIRYRGAIDDQYGYEKSEHGGVGTYRKDEPSTHYLRDALDVVLAGKTDAIRHTDPLGCALGLNWEPPANAPAGAPTFHRDVQPILNAHCARCHRDGTAAPFALEDFDDAHGWADMISEVVSDRRMPPWGASPKFGKFANDSSLSTEEIATIERWVEAGCPKGDSEHAPKKPTWPTGWAIGEPDIVYDTPKYRVPAEGTLPYRYVRVRTKFDEHKWVSAAQIRSTGNEVVHHVLTFVIPPKGRRKKPGAPWEPKWGVMDLFRHLPRGERREHMLRNQKYLRDFRVAGGGVFGFFVAQLPGDIPMDSHPDRAIFLPAGATIVFQIHYTPDGTERETVTSLGLKFRDTPPKEVRDMHAMTSVTFEIPPQAENHEEVIEHRFQRGGQLLSLSPHMHLRGKSFRYVLERRDGSEEVLLDVPEFDFDWQLQYVLEQPIRFERGERLRGIAVFDNSKSNPYNPDPDASVFFGLQTEEEMLIGYFEAIWDRE